MDETTHKSPSKNTWHTYPKDMPSNEYPTIPNRELPFFRSSNSDRSEQLANTLSQEEIRENFSFVIGHNIDEFNFFSRLIDEKVTELEVLLASLELQVVKE